MKVLKSDKDLESDNKHILIDTPKINDNNTSSVYKEKYQYASTDDRLRNLLAKLYLKLIMMPIA